MATVELPKQATLISGESEEAAENEEMSRQAAIAPRAIPSRFWNKIEEDVISYIQHEIGSAEGERSEYFNRVARWKALYDAPLNAGAKKWPFANASNVTVPLIKEIVNTLSSQVVQSTMTTKPRFILKDLAKEWEPFVHPIEMFLDAAAERELNYDQAMVKAIVECCKVGTSIVETNYEVELRRSYRYTSDGSKVYPKNLVKRDGPIVRNVPLQNFWIRFSEESIQEAPWVGKELWLNKNQIRQMQVQGLLRKDTADKLMKWKQKEDEGDEVKQTEDQLQGTEATAWNKYQIFEIHMRWDVDSDPDGMLEDIVVYYHRASGMIVGALFAPYWSGERPFHKFGYFPKPNQFYDEGLAEMLEQIQVAISATQNRRGDNAMLANLKMIIKRRAVKGIMPGDPLYPGKVIEVNDIYNDMREFQMSEIYPSTVSEEQILRGYAERLSGYNDAVAGAAQPVTRTTATAQLALLQEQARRLDLTIRNVREAQTEVGRAIVALYNQHGTLGKAIAWMGEAGKAVEAIFALPRRVNEVGDALRVSSPTSTSNRQVKRESSLQMFNLLNSLYQQMIPLAAQLTSPDQLAPIVREMITGAKRFMQDTLESFEVTNPDEVLSALTLLEQILPNARDLGGLEDFQRAETTTQILDSVGRVENLLREAEGASGRGPGLLGSGQPNRENAENPGTTQRNLASLYLGGEPSGGS